MSSKQRWLASQWPWVRLSLPAAPATVVDLGCGRIGGFVPALEDWGYEALGVDPDAPEGASYRRTDFEHAELPDQVDAVIASTSLHHIAEPGDVVDRIRAMLRPEGVMIVVEWDWESFDQATAEWCFERLGAPAPEGWLDHHRRRWTASGEPWDNYLRAWADREGLHSAQELIRELDRRFHRERCQRGPYFFPDLAETSEADELDAINTGQIRATRIDYVGRS